MPEEGHSVATRDFINFVLGFLIKIASTFAVRGTRKNDKQALPNRLHLGDWSTRARNCVKENESAYRKRPRSQRCETNFNVHLFGCRRSRWSYARLRSKQTHKRNQLAFKYPTYLSSSEIILHRPLSVHFFRFVCNRRPPVSSCSCVCNVHRFSCTTNSVTQTQWNFSISDDVLTTTPPIASIRILFAFQEM